MQDIALHVGQRIRALRKKVGWSLEELGERADLHPTFIGDLERGKTDVTLKSLSKLAAALKVTISDLCDSEKAETERAVVELQIIRFIRRQNFGTLKLIGMVVEDIEEWLHKSKKRAERRP